MTAAGGSKGDELLDRGADKLEELSQRAAARGGLAAKLSDELADDASFLRKLKPSLIVARARGNQAARTVSERPRPSPAVEPRRAGADGTSPFVLAGAAFAVGAVLAKLIDWRSHAHPRR